MLVYEGEFDIQVNRVASLQSVQTLFHSHS
jgi:hypothetical protein